MDTEVMAKVEDDKRETGSCTEGGFVELGVVSKDTHGYGFIFPDGGPINSEWF